MPSEVWVAVVTPETKATAIDAIGFMHDTLLEASRNKWLNQHERNETARHLRRCRRALRELRVDPLVLPRNECE